MSTKEGLGRMTEAQREMVEKNLGLVGTQTKRMLGRSVRSVCAGDYWDMFQEGCLGLIQAVRSYDPNSGMTFATYAIPRIRYASWRALHRYRESIRRPERHCRVRRHPPEHRRSPMSVAHTDAPRVRTCSPEEMNALPDDSRPGNASDGYAEDGGRSGLETIGGRVRQKLESAVDTVVGRLSSSTKSRRDRGKLARTLADQRLLVPNAEFRASLRQIAGETGSSYGRVAACEALLVAEVRRILSEDAEFEFLREEGASRREGMAAAIDDKLRGTLRRRVTDRIIGVFGDLPRVDQADMLLTVLENGGVDIGSLLRAHADSLADGDRTRLVAKVAPNDSVSCRGAGVRKRAVAVLAAG